MKLMVFVLFALAVGCSARQPTTLYNAPTSAPSPMASAVAMSELTLDRVDRDAKGVTDATDAAQNVIDFLTKDGDSLAVEPANDAGTASTTAPRGAP